MASETSCGECLLDNHFYCTRYTEVLLLGADEELLLQSFTCKCVDEAHASDEVHSSEEVAWDALQDAEDPNHAWENYGLAIQPLIARHSGKDGKVCGDICYCMTRSTCCGGLIAVTQWGMQFPTCAICGKPLWGLGQ